MTSKKDSDSFKYQIDGFTILLKEGLRSIKWGEIEKLQAYKLDLFTVDMLVLEIVLDHTVVTITEEEPGWDGFVEKLNIAFPNIPKDWDWKIIQPPFATNFTILFEKSAQ